MIDNEFLRTDADERERIQLLNAVVSWGGNAQGFAEDLSVVVFGSLIRGDYWKGSDLDIIPIGGTQTDRVRVIRELGEVGRKCGAKSVEQWDAVSRDYFEELRAVPTRERSAPYPPQFGLHGFDTIGHHITVLGKDPLVAMPFPRGEELQGHLEERMDAFNKRGHPWEDKVGNTAPEAIKVAVLLASVRQGLAPSRHKHTVVSLFEQFVPEFEGRAQWKDVWRRYKSGDSQLVTGEIAFRDALIEKMKRTN